MSPSDDLPMFGCGQPERLAYLEPRLRHLTNHHLRTCAQYRNVVSALFPTWETSSGLEGLPFLPVGIFKARRLQSVAADDVFKIVASSGTTGTPSRVILDRETAANQSRTLTGIMTSRLGSQRRPMLIVDTNAVVDNPSEHTARAAGVLGMMSLGRKHTFLLDDHMEERHDRLIEFVAEHRGRDLLIFGFTFMVWKHLYQRFGTAGIDLSGATVVHSGGWKKMEDQRVGNPEFKSALRDAFGIEDVVNFYGMAEQVGSVFLEGEDGRLHPSKESDVLIRHPDDLRVLPNGEMGLIQVFSSLPTSYPGHSILTEDLGVIEAVDDPSSTLGGASFRVIGRAARSEVRGCSDAYQMASAS